MQVLKARVTKPELVFLVTPIIDSLQDLMDKGLSLTSFALHDSKTRELLLQKDAMQLKHGKKDHSRRLKKGWWPTHIKKKSSSASKASSPAATGNAQASGPASFASEAKSRTSPSPRSSYKGPSTSSVSSCPYANGSTSCTEALGMSKSVSFESAVQVHGGDMPLVQTLNDSVLTCGMLLNPRTRLIQAFREVSSTLPESALCFSINSCLLSVRPHTHNATFFYVVNG